MAVDEAVAPAQLERTVRTLAGRFPGRHVWRPERLEGAADWVADELRGQGHTVQEQAFTARFHADIDGTEASHRCRNLIAEVPGTARQPARVLIIGAHYDSRVGMATQQARRPRFDWTGATSAERAFMDTPGANDNASGIAAMLALAGAFAGTRPAATLRFIAWANEEYPFFRNVWARAGGAYFAEGMGSHAHARRCREHRENVSGVIALDTLGAYGPPDEADRPAGHRLLRGLFPAGADYVAFMSNRRSRRFLREVHGAFAANATVPSIRRAFPLMDLLNAGWSDDWAYWRCGYNGLIVTDTAYLRHRHYHRTTDLPEHLNFPVFARVVEGLRAAVVTLAGAG